MERGPALGRPSSNGPTGQALDPDRLDQLDRMFARGSGADSRVAEAGAELGRAGENYGRVGALFTGWAFRHVLLGNGRRQIVDVLLPGDAFGLEALFDDTRALAATQTLTPVTYGLIEHAELRRLLAESPAFGQALLRRLIAERRATDRHLTLIGRCDAEERLATFLVELHRRLRRRKASGLNSFNLPLTQQQIGDYLGLTVVHVNRVLRRFRELGLVTVHNRVVVFHDLTRLRKLVHFGEELMPQEAA